MRDEFALDHSRQSSLNTSKMLRRRCGYHHHHENRHMQSYWTEYLKSDFKRIYIISVLESISHIYDYFFVSNISNGLRFGPQESILQHLQCLGIGFVWWLSHHCEGGLSRTLLMVKWSGKSEKQKHRAERGLRCYRNVIHFLPLYLSPFNHNMPPRWKC